MAHAISGPLSLAVLSLLAERPMHPYEIATTLRGRGKDAAIKVTYGTLYGAIRALADQGFVVARRTERRGGRPERTVYAITAEGEADLRDRLRGLLRDPIREYRAFGAALALMTVLPPDEVASLLADRIAHLGEMAARLQHGLEALKKAGVPRTATVGREYDLTMVEAERAWVSSISRLVSVSPAFTRHWPSSTPARADAPAEAPAARRASTRPARAQRSAKSDGGGASRRT
jgi:DNA-binding PadR family transcriptional regulator